SAAGVFFCSFGSTQHIISSSFSFDQPINAVRNDKRAPADLDDVQLFGSYKLKQFRPSDSKILASCSFSKEAWADGLLPSGIQILVVIVHRCATWADN